MLNEEKFVPYYPCPHKNKLSAGLRFYHGLNSWIHTLFEKSYTMQMGHVKTPALDLYIVNERNLVKEITETRSEDFPKHSIQHEILCPLLGNNIFTSNGAEWRRQREMINPAFSYTRLNLSFATMQEATKDLIARIERMDTTRPIEIDPLMTYVTADIIFRTILSKKLNEDEADRVFESFNQYQNVTQKIIICRINGIPAPFLKYRQKQAAKKIREVLSPLISQRYEAYYQRQERHADILDTLLEARAPETGVPFSLGELTNHVAMLFLAGHETSASALTWSLYLLSRCPGLQDSIRHEIQNTTQGSEISHAALKHFENTRNLFREALRLFPPVSFLPREARKEETFRNKNISKGSMISISPWLIQRHKEQWKDPDMFDPDRFQDEAQKESVRSSYIPFGCGPRICVGQGFAQQEALLVLSSITKRFALRPSQGREPEPISRVTLRPRKAIKIFFQPI